MYTDIHCHILYNTDDGPSTSEQMLEMLECAYSDGIRTLCVTPHFNFSFYGDNVSRAEEAYALLLREISARYPDMTLCRGNEIFFHDGCTEHLADGSCKSLNGTKHILVDFASSEQKYAIISAIKKLVSCGYIPILAHTERYRSLGFSTSAAMQIKEMGALIQVNAASVIGKNGIRQKLTAMRLIRRGLCDVVASDAHNTDTRKSYMHSAYNYIKDKFGNRTAERLMAINPHAILNTHKLKHSHQ